METLTNTSNTETQNIVLDVRDLNVHFGEQHVLKGVNLKFERNQLHSIIGPSGCGKSTLIRCFNRMHELLGQATIAGEILLNGENILVQDPFAVRLKCGMVFQRPNPLPNLSIYDNVLAGFLVSGYRLRKSEADEIVETALNKAVLWNEVKDKLKKRSTFLSGGQQQRLCIARALAVEPEVLLLDEPTSAIDPIGTGHIEELMLELKKSVTILLVTHNLSQAARISDYTAFFFLGELVEYAPGAQFFLNPKDAKSEAYIQGRFG